MDELDGGGDVNDIPNLFAAKSRVGEQCDHRPHTLATAVDQMARNIRQFPLPRTDRADEIFFDEFELSADEAKRIVGSLQ